MTDDRSIGARLTAGSQGHIPIWFIGWVFTIGYVNLPFWKAVFALVIWPYYLGAAIR